MNIYAYMCKEASRVVLSLQSIKKLKCLKKLYKYLVDYLKSSTFAIDLRLRLVNFKNGANLTKNRNAENQPLTKKV